MRTLLQIASLCLLGQASCLAAFDAFMGLKVTGGPAVESDAENRWVKILGFSQGLEQPITIGGKLTLTAGVATADEVTLQMASDGSIATMLNGLTKGTSFSLTLQMLRNSGINGPSVLEEMFFEGIRFSKIAGSGSDGGDFLSFDISFAYQQLTVTHTSIDAKGAAGSPTAAGWNFIVSAPLAVTPRVPGVLVYGTEGYLPPAPPPDPDRDGDGMPNTWEDQYGFNPDSSLDAPLDADGDGFSNLKEYIAGTHPRQGNSFFQVKVTLAVATPEPIVELTWSAVAGKTYRVEASARPDSGFATLHTLTPAAGGIQTYLAPAGSGVFFRLGVQ